MRKTRIAAVTALCAVAVFGTMRPASAVTYHTMRPYTNSAWCVADLSTSNVVLINPCNAGTVEGWGVSPSPYGGGYEQIRNQATGKCMQTDGYHAKLNTAPCNGDEAQAWFEILGPGSTWTTWQSPYVVNGNALCADASTQYGVRAWDCNGGNAQKWYGPQ